MKKVILLTLMMPYLASGQIIESAGTGSVIISEIMADPSPPVGLPAREYIEVHNRNSFPVSLEGWKYVSGESIVLLPQVEIGPLEYLILVHENYRNEYLSMGRCAGLKQFPVLTDGGKTLRLLDAAGKLIHGVEYSVSWYGEKLKAEGGWSLEMIDCNHPFSGSANWRASRSPTGGTPGKVNSVDGLNPDDYFAGIINVFPFDDMHLLVQFSEPVLILEGDPGAVRVNGSPVGSVVHQDPLFSTFIATTSAPVSEGKVHSLAVEDRISDFSGNKARRKDFLFGLPSKAEKGDILFNELFFNPADDGYDYLELVNVSEKILDASDLYLASVSE
jgi:hypothetical protein